VHAPLSRRVRLSYVSAGITIGRLCASHVRSTALRPKGRSTAFPERCFPLKLDRLPIAAVLTGDLIRRQKAIGDPKPERESNAPRVLLTSILLSVCSTVLGQAVNSEQVPTFEVASVKLSNPNKSGSTFNFVLSGLEITGGTLRSIMETAYDVRTFQILGGPKWMDADRYDITAKNAHDDPALQGLSQQDRVKETRRRLQTLLAERFQLKVHRETRELPEYALVVVKSGVKLKEADSSLPGGGTSTNCGVMKGTRATMTNLGVVLSRQLSQPVIDRSNLTGKYDFELIWSPDTGCEARPNSAAGATDDPVDRPSLFTALQEQIGLKLEAIKGPVEVIVVEHAEKPDAN
jgi:uncharacterized protein (TIGR03435 family)